MDLNKKIFIVKPSDNSSTSPSASFCKILAVITIIGGLIVAASSASVVNSYSSDGGFSFGVFLSSFVVYGVAGGFLFCMAELLENIHSINQSLKELSVYESSNSIHRVQVEGIVNPVKDVQEDKSTVVESTSASAPITSTINNNDGESLHVTPVTNSSDRIKCPVCGTVQPNNRLSCYHCGAKFD